ncbi:MAG: 6-bladed beta-propeller [Bacteroidales bacterium]|nr:6-bladed beta-propeller [Bacteroidales bacterium]
MKASICISLMFVLLLTSCNDHKKNKVGQKFKSTVSLTIPLQETKDHFVGQYVENIQYIKLENTEDAFFNSINKLIFKNQKFYLFELMGRNRVLVFNEQGHFMNSVGTIGGGPGEYTRLRNFTVFNDTVYLLNRDKKELLLYHDNGQYIKTDHMPFRASDIVVLGRDRYMLALDPMDLEENQILITDNRFHVIRTPIHYSDNTTDLLTISMLKEVPNAIVYHRPINDSIYIFDYTGELTSIACMDFGSKSVPADIKNNFTEVIKDARSNYSRYAHMNQTPLIVNNFLIGNITQNNSRWSILINMNTNQGITNQYKTGKYFDVRNIFSPLCSFGDNLVVSQLSHDWLDPDASLDIIPEDILDHIAEGGYVLCIYTINNKK